MILNILLNEAVSSVQSLKEYYVSQIDVVLENTMKGIERYKYGVALEKFFYSKIYANNEELLEEGDQNCIDEILESYTIEEDEKGSTIQYKLKNHTSLVSEYELQPKKATAEFMRLVERPRILNESTLIMLLIRYEEIISGIWRFLVNKYPNAYLKDKAITYAELIAMDEDFRSIKKRFLDKEVDEIMRQPISDWYELYKSKHKAQFEFGDEFSKFKEIYYRRNLIVHNQGVVNDIYLANVETELNCGDRVVSDKEYVLEAFETTQLVIYGTIYGLKKLTENVEDLQNSLFDIGYKHMLDAEWKLSEYIFGLLMGEKEQSEADRGCSKVNYWISVKNQGRFEEIRAEIERFDVSALSGQFKVAKAALLDEFKKVSLLLEEIIEKEVPASHVEEWPLFIQYRASENYVDFRKRHKEKFEIQDYQPEYPPADIDQENIIDEFGEEMEEI